jgi:hypothetical protein
LADPGAHDAAVKQGTWVDADEVASPGAADAFDARAVDIAATFLCNREMETTATLLSPDQVATQPPPFTAEEKRLLIWTRWSQPEDGDWPEDFLDIDLGAATARERREEAHETNGNQASWRR